MNHLILSLIVMGLCWSGNLLQGAGTEVEIPSNTEILKSLHAGHPRLLARQQDFDDLKKRVALDPELQRWQENLKKQGERILGQEPSTYSIPDGLRLLSTSRRVVTRMFTLGMLYRLDGDRRWVDRAWRELDAAAHFPDWNTRHFLDTAEMTLAFGIGFDWIFDAWTPEQKDQLRQAMMEKGLRPGLSALKGGETFSWWSKSQHNWNQVCNGGLSVGALALAELEPDLASDLLHRALVSLQLPMKEFAPDGAWIEGPGYWNYATSYNCYLLASLQSALGTDFGLSQMPAFDKTGMFPIYITGPFGHTFNYADGGEEAIVAPQMFWLANTFNRPQYADYQRELSRGTALDLLWQRPFPTSSAPAPLDACFHKSEIASFRSSWQDKSALFAAIKAGDNKANHGHLDLGSFVLDALGVRWVSDLGADDYNLPGFFGSKRWEYYRLRAEGHNTLVINPGSQPDQDPKAEAQLIRFSSRPEFAFTIADLTPAYSGRAQKVQRGLAMLARKRIVVQDEIEMDKPGQFWWFCHTTAQITLDADGKGAVLEKNDQRLRVTLANPPEARFEIMDAQPLPDSPHPKGQNANKDIRKLSLHLDGIKSACIRVCFTLLTDGQQDQQPLPPVQPLSVW